MILSLLLGFSWSLFLAQSCNVEKACLTPSPRHFRVESATQLIHDRGPPMVFVAGEQEHGGANVFVKKPRSDLGQCGSESEHGFRMERYLRASWAGSQQNRRALGPREGSRDRTGRTRSSFSCDFQAVLDDAARVDGTGTCHRPLHFRGSRV